VDVKSNMLLITNTNFMVFSLCWKSYASDICY